ncbi:MAG: ribonuclease R, partial [Luteibaculum sp.]
MNVESILEKGLIQIFKLNPSQSFNYKQIAAKLSIADKETRETVIGILNNLVEKKVISEEGRGKYKYNSQKNALIGQIEITKKGTGFILLENAKDLFISAKNTHTAFDGDLVRVKASVKKGRPEYVVTEVIERNKKVFTGIVQLAESYAFVKPDDPKVPVDFYIRENDILTGVLDGQKVVVEFVEWKDPERSPYGKIIQVLGFPGDNEAEIHAVMAMFNLPTKFPEEVTAEANKLYKQNQEEEKKKRR